ncbi:MAG: carboxypeptidase-like regulatory domain-containing protein, partial [Bryobacteraceae bacterium]
MRFLFAFFLLFVLVSTVLMAQIASGTISVVAEDSTGAVIPNATVAVTNKNTGLTRTGPTSANGEFLAPFLPAGEYSISVELQGFKRASVALFTLQVDQNATVRVRLTPGDVVETVQVTEATPLLEAD